MKAMENTTEWEKKELVKKHLDEDLRTLINDCMEEGEAENAIIFLDALLSAKDADLERAIEEAYRKGIRANGSFKGLKIVHRGEIILADLKQLKAKYLNSEKKDDGQE